MVKTNNSNVPEIKIPDPTEAVRAKYDNILSLVIVVLFIGFITLLVTVFGLVIDSWNVKTAAANENTNEEQLLAAQQAQLLEAIQMLNQSTATKAMLK
jgi:hypothetical protein